jgi:triosephosphate isomerase
MVVPEGVPVDKYETTFIYEKNGEKKEFSLNNYPAKDSTWRFIEQKSVLIKKGYVPPIHDFQITDQNGDDITNEILSNKGYSVLMISKKIAEARGKYLSAGFALGKYCVVKSIKFYIISASGKDEVKGYENGLPFCSADETTLKTMMRANPGYILLKDGMIINKWSWANIPNEEWFGKLSDNYK